MPHGKVDPTTDGLTTMAYSRADLAVGTVTNRDTDNDGFITVTFPTPLASVPVFVACSATAPDGGALDPPGFALIDSKTTGGFVARWWRSSEPPLLFQSRTLSFTWIAVLG